jgi:hypothetical protein
LPGVLFREDLNFIWSTTRNFIISTVYILPCYPDRIKGVGQVADVIVGVPLALLRRRSAARQRNIISYSSHRGDSYCVVPRASPHYFSFGNYDSYIRVITALADPLGNSVHFHQYTSPFATLPSVLFYKEGLYISMQYSTKP